MEGYLISWFLYDLWIVYLFLYIKSHSLRFIKSKRVGLITFSILLLFIVFGEHSGDFRHYEEIVDKFSRSDQVATNFEPVYIWLTKATGYNITLFRTIIGSVIIICIYRILNLYNELNEVAIFIFTLIPFYFLSNAIRQGVAICIFLLGLFYILKKRNIIISILLIVASFYLHKSTFLIIPALLFLAFPLKKNTVFVFITILPILIYLENILLQYILFNLMGNGVVATYMMRTNAETSTFLVRLLDLLFIIVIFTLIYLSLKKIHKKSDLTKNKSIQLMARFLFGCSFMYAIYHGLAIEVDVVSARFAPFMYIPLVIVLMKAYGTKIMRNQIIVSLFFVYFILINLQLYRWFLVFF